MKPVAFRWIDPRILLWLHEESLAEHGGLEGLRDAGLLESALARPRNVLAYRNDASLAELASAYAVGITRNHAFNDGNKREALLAIGLFLSMHGYRLAVSQAEAVQCIYAVARGDMKEEELTAWIDRWLQKR